MRSIFRSSKRATPERVKPENSPHSTSPMFPNGHFYSTIVDPADMRARENIIWKTNDNIAGIDLRKQEQFSLLRDLKPYVGQIDYPIDDPGNRTSYFYRNDQYPVLDAQFLFAALCHFKPRHMIEVGSGYSSLISADVNRRILESNMEFVCIEPFPRQFLLDGVDGVSELVQMKVEDVELSFFDRLVKDDILFIDSSHVSKTGSDVNYLFFEVLPRLNKGVLVHIHDIFLPDEYPKVWVIDECRNWNEQYLVRAFLQFNAVWEIVWMSHYMGTRHTRSLQAVFPDYPKLGGGGSLWIRKTVKS